MTIAIFRQRLMLLSVILIGTPTWAAPASQLAGVWQQDDNSNTVRIAPCGSGASLCATVIAEQLASGEPSLLNKIVARDIRPSGKKIWKGRYVADGQSMSATAKLSGKDRMTFKVCAMALICDSLRFKRIGD